MSILQRILATKAEELEALRRLRPLDEVRAAARDAPATRSLAAALAPGVSDERFRIIAEVKKASPSKGVIRPDFDPVAIAAAYERGGAAAVSVLTDETYFQGRLDFLQRIRERIGLPVLRKDFLIDEYQVWEARAAGADAVLLILAALGDDQLDRLRAVTEALGMEVLWEVHDLEELRRVQKFSPRLVGVNNRDLTTFEVSLETTRRLIPDMPREALVVSESGFFERHELEMMRTWGAHGFLIGESLMRAADPADAVASLVGGGR